VAIYERDFPGRPPDVAARLGLLAGDLDGGLQEVAEAAGETERIVIDEAAAATLRLSRDS
jgi:hypothetical protein